MNLKNIKKVLRPTILISVVGVISIILTILSIVIIVLITKYGGQLHRINSSYNTLYEEREAYKTEVEWQAAEIEKYKAEIEEYEADMANYKTAVVGYDTKIDDYKAKIDEYESIIDAYEIEVQRLKEDDKSIIFVGNSLVEGLRLNSGSDFVFLSKGGINIDGLKTDIYETLTQYECERVVIELGTNELGLFSKEQFINSYKELIKHIRSINKDSEIICMSIPPVTYAKSSSDERVNNDNVQHYNQYILEMCLEDEGLVYLDNAAFFSNALNTEWSGDGVHLYGSIYKRWYDFIMEEIGKLDN